MKYDLSATHQKKIHTGSRLFPSYKMQFKIYGTRARFTISFTVVALSSEK